MTDETKGRLIEAGVAVATIAAAAGILWLLLVKAGI